MKLFLDTEFSDFKAPRLISLGIAAESGHTFYAEIEPGEWFAHVSTFVTDKVLPLLGHAGVEAQSRRQAGKALREWLDALDDDLVVVADYVQDWDLFEALVRESGCWPACLENVYEPFDPSMSNVLVGADRVEARERWYSQRGMVRHHALHDAQALHAAYVGLNCHSRNDRGCDAKGS
jgi:hypothetical protein